MCGFVPIAIGPPLYGHQSRQNFMSLNQKITILTDCRHYAFQEV